MDINVNACNVCVRIYQPNIHFCTKPHVSVNGYCSWSQDAVVFDDDDDGMTKLKVDSVAVWKRLFVLFVCIRSDNRNGRA